MHRSTHHHNLLSLLIKFLELPNKACDSDPDIVRSYEDNSKLFLEVSPPSLTSLYHPSYEDNLQSWTNSLYQEVTKLSIQTLLHILYITLGHHHNLLNLIHNNLLDYVVRCLPWIVPSNSYQRAQEVWQEVGKAIKLQPCLCFL